jgi:CSLREA domain-containing protein
VGKQLLGTRLHDRKLRYCALAAALIASLLAFASPAPAATINVTTTADEFNSGPRCSLREAVWAANNNSSSQAQGCAAGAGNDVLNLPAGTFRLTRSNPFVMGSTVPDDNAVNGDLDVTAPLTIKHAGARPAVIQSNVSDRVFHNFAPGPGLSLSRVVVSSGRAGAGSEYGGGILNQGTLTIRDSALVRNSATFGGALSTQGTSTATLSNTTISGNSATEDGGGLSVETGGTVKLTSVTVSANQADSNRDGGGDGGGAAASTSGAGGRLEMRNTLMAGNTDRGGEAHDCVEFGGAIVSLGRTMVGNAGGCGLARGPGDIRNRSAQVLPLTDNGGPTPTHALRKTSPAVNHGVGCTRNDQRGVARRFGGGRCDIGAWELARCAGVVINRVGTNASERLSGTSTADGILALGGGDVLAGLGGNDGLCGGAGGDRLEGGAGNDKLVGGPGRDRCIGGGGRNRAVNCELPKRGR